MSKLNYFHVYVEGEPNHRVVRGVGEWYEENPGIIQVGNIISPWTNDLGTVLLEIKKIQLIEDMEHCTLSRLDVKHCGYVPGTERKPRVYTPWEKVLLGK